MMSEKCPDPPKSVLRERRSEGPRLRKTACRARLLLADEDDHHPEREEVRALQPA